MRIAHNGLGDQTRRYEIAHLDNAKTGIVVCSEQRAMFSLVFEEKEARVKLTDYGNRDYLNGDSLPRAASGVSEIRK